MRPPALKQLEEKVAISQATSQVKKLEETVKAHEATISKLSAALDRARHTPRAKKVASAAPQRRGKDDVLRVIIPDTHGAKADPKALAACLGDVKALDPSEIILLGDHVDCGGFLAAHHTLGYVDQSGYTYESDIAATNSFLDALQLAAPRASIAYIEGNHERRIEAWSTTQSLRNQRDAEFLRRAFAPEFLLYLSQRGISYHRQGVFYDNLQVPGVIRRGKCFFTHGSSTSKQATTTMLGLFGSNLVFGHTHRAQSSTARPVASGTISAWNPGCLCELQPLWCHTAPTSWSHGFAVQTVARSGNFLHVNVPIVGGISLLGKLSGNFS